VLTASLETQFNSYRYVFLLQFLEHGIHLPVNGFDADWEDNCRNRLGVNQEGEVLIKSLSF